MPLTDRQKRTYTWRCDIYKPPPPMVGKNGKALLRRFNPTPDYANVPFRFVPTPETDFPRTPVGRTKQVNLVTLDKGYFLPEQEIFDGCVINLRVKGHPLDGGWWYVQDNSKTDVDPRFLQDPYTARRANYKYVYLKRGPRPTGVTAKQG